ncbi:Type-1 fimbrial protein, A chain precursor [compost metagenome]
MQKSLLSIMLATGLGIAGLAPMTTFAADGTIYFNGMIEEATCTVSGGTGTDGGIGDITVTLPTVSKSALDASGRTAGDTPFELIFGGQPNDKCTDGKIVSLHFEPTLSGGAVNASTGNLKNLAASGASSVEVGLRDNAYAPINLYTSAGSPQGTVASGTATVKYIGQYVATGAAGSGPVATQVAYSVQYN